MYCKKRHLAEIADTMECYGLHVYVKESYVLPGYLFFPFCVLLIHLMHALLHVVFEEFLLSNFCFPHSAPTRNRLQATAYTPRLWVTASLFRSPALGQLALLSQWKATLNTICLYLLLSSSSTLTMQCSTTQIPGKDVMVSPLWPVYDREDK